MRVERLTGIFMTRLSLRSPGTTPESVELRGVESEQVLVQSHSSLSTGLSVRVRKGHRHSAGVVLSCEQDGNRFLIRIKVTKGSDWLLRLHPRENEFDPGALCVDDFLSMEQLSALMGEVSAKSHNAR
jgi:hypothetical protein